MAKYRRRAEWVWRPRQLGGAWNVDLSARLRDEGNRYVYFRKSFDLDGEVADASVDVSADGRYQLFVNGQRVGRGPARCSPDWQYYDTYDIRPYLRPGRNVVAALVHSYGRNFAWYELPRWEAATAFGCGGWFLQGEVTTTSGAAVHLDTDDTWRCRPSEAWQQDTASGWVGYAEVYDARRAPAGWQESGFTDTDWEAAQVLRAPGMWSGSDVVPFPVMVPRDIPYLAEELHWPAALLKAGEIQNAPGALEEAVSAEELSPLAGCRLVDAAALLGPDGETSVQTDGERSVSLVLDFGKTETGRVTLDVSGPAGALIDVRYGERLAPDGRVEVRPWSYGPDTYVQTHRVILGDQPLRWEQFDYAGFRYLQLTVRHSPQPLRIRQAGVNFTSYPVGGRGRFACSDPQLDAIYRISAYTLQCCMHDSYEDCPSREQRQWTNDQYVHLSANYGLFGDPHLARKLLVQVAQSQRPDGQVMMCAPGDFAAITNMNMSEFTLHWIMSIPQYVRYTGDRSVIHQLYPTVVKGLEWFERHLNDDDLLENVPGVLWIDWSEVDKRGELTEINARFAGCLRIAAAFAQELGIGYDAGRYGELADKVCAAINRHLWDEGRGVYVDTRRDGVQSRRVSQVCNVAAMYFGVAPRERWPRILRYILDEERVRLTNASGIYGTVPFDEEHDVVLAHAFYMHFLHAILAQEGRGAGDRPQPAPLVGTTG